MVLLPYLIGRNTVLNHLKFCRFVFFLSDYRLYQNSTFVCKVLCSELDKFFHKHNFPLGWVSFYTLWTVSWSAIASNITIFLFKQFQVSSTAPVFVFSSHDRSLYNARHIKTIVVLLWGWLWLPYASESAVTSRDRGGNGVGSRVRQWKGMRNMLIYCFNKVRLGRINQTRSHSSNTAYVCVTKWF